MDPAQADSTSRVGPPMQPVPTGFRQRRRSHSCSFGRKYAQRLSAWLTSVARSIATLCKQRLEPTSWHKPFRAWGRHLGTRTTSWLGCPRTCNEIDLAGGAGGWRALWGDLPSRG
eukprot:3243074-Alexandrium_andersonii.AAC.1